MTRDYNIKCAVKDCENHSNEGQFVGLLCLPCHRFIAGDGGLYSQAFRNSSDMIKQAVEAEREACAKIVYGLCVSDNNAQEIVNAIRARGSHKA
jgi:hypothetical protein